MPSLKVPQTLFNLCVNKFVECFMTEWFVNARGKCTMALSLIPAIILKDIMSLILAYIGKANVFQSSFPNISGIFSFLSIEHLTHLDLSLLSTTKASDIYLNGFKSEFVTALPSLRNLMFLSLKTNPQHFSLPVCDDNVLYYISIYCPSLKYLNIANNTEVTDKGLSYLVPIPLYNHAGCEKLEEIVIYDCSLSADGIAFLLEHLANLKDIGYPEMGNVFRIFNMNRRQIKPSKLNLISFKNVGPGSRTCENIGMLRFTKKIALCVSTLCPSIQKLNIRVTDEDVANLQYFTSLTKLVLIYNLKVPLSPGQISKIYFSTHGFKLTNLAFVCNIFSTEYFLFLGKSCPNLTELWARCNTLNNDLNLNSDECVGLHRKLFEKLESFSLRVGISESSICSVPIDNLCFVLEHTSILSHLRLVFRSVTMTDTAVERMWNSMNTDYLQNVSIMVPNLNELSNLILLTESSAKFIINESPALKKLENLQTWSLTTANVETIYHLIRSHNYDVEVVTKVEVVR